MGCTPPGPLSEGERTSPRPAATLNPPDPLSKGEGPAHEALEGIDSLMWVQPDSALKVMMEFAGSPEADSMDVFEGHYCQVLIAELLFKNDYKQSNRTEVVKAVRYFDSIVGMDGYGTDTRGVSVQEREAFLAARAHYINGVGLYEHDSVVAACAEYLKALEIMETHFPNLETQDVASLRVEHLPRFMGLTYGRLAELFSGQYMQEPAIVCCKKSLEFQEIEPGSPLNQSSLLFLLGKQYDKLNQNDSAAHYYNEALRMLPDTNNIVYRDIVSMSALLSYEYGNGYEPSIRDLKRMVPQAADEKEKLNRYLTIGCIYCIDNQYDSALAYLTPVFENSDGIAKYSCAPYLRTIYQSRGDSLMVSKISIYYIENTVSEGTSNAKVSRLNEMFQKHLEWERDEAAAKRQDAARHRMIRNLIVIVIVLLVLCICLWRWLAKRKRELQTQMDDALQQSRAMLPQRVKDIYSSKVGNRLERIMDEFEAAYPEAMGRMAAAYPDLTPTERRIFVLSHLQFRAKEMADLLELSENTVNQYRYNLRKKTENASFSSFLD